METRRTKEDLLNDLIIEAKELNEKITRLDAFIVKVESDNYDDSIHNVSGLELCFMKDQLKFMNDYLKALVFRIVYIKY